MDDDSSLQTARSGLASDSRGTKLGALTLNSGLALANAASSAVSATCAIGAWIAIRGKRARRHRNLMIAAVTASALFLVTFVARFVRFGFTPFRGHGPLRAAYLAIFFSHEPLSVVAVPIVIAAFVLGLLRSVRAHREVAPIALFVWLYSLVTGVMLYVLVYLVQDS